MIRFLRFAAAFAVGFVGVFTAWLGLSLLRALPHIPHLAASVTRDERGVPWIEAKNAADAYFALGYVHAQDRLFQMEMMRRTGQARLSEILGAGALGTDRFLRSLQLYPLAEDAVAGMDAETAEVLNAYTAGVNAFLDQVGGALPIEFKVMFFKPEPWRPADSLVWQKLMGLQLSGNWDEEMLRAQLIQRLGREKANELFPDAAATGPSTLAALPDNALQQLADYRRIVQPTLASNIWAIAPSRTATGGAILANDPHLNFASPNLWYLAGVSYPGVNLIGATVPGVPFHLLGHNGKLAWGFTTTHGDTQDLFAETVIDGNTYEGPNGAEKFEKIQETINVRFGTPHTFTIHRTRHGPIIGETEIKAGATVYAYAATLFAPDDRSSDAIFQMARATTTQDFLTASARFHAPQQNVMFVDDHGSIGYAAVGRVPLRKGPDCDGLTPASGKNGTCDWTGWADFSAVPQSIDPPAGVLINANNRIVPDDYPLLIAKDWPEPYRAIRITETIADRAGITLDQTRALQQDQVSLMARELVPIFLMYLDKNKAQRAELTEKLLVWDGDTQIEKIEPLLFTVWLSFAKARIIDDDLGPLADEFYGDRPLLLKTILTDKPHWCGDCTAAVTDAWNDAIAWLEQNAGKDAKAWTWGRFHIADFRHPVFGMFSDIGSFSIPTGGDNATVNRGSPSRLAGRTPLRHRHGPGFRGIYDSADFSKSLFTVAGGQSALILSPHLRDLLPSWRDGAYFRLTPPLR